MNNNRKFTEIKRLRRENTKVFRDENGAYKMQVYPHNVHYYDEETGIFEEKNRIYKKTTRGFKTTDGKRETEFFCNDDTQENVEIRLMDMALSMQFNAVTPLLEQKRMHMEKRKLAIHPHMNNNKGSIVEVSTRPSAIFEDIIDGVDIEYISEGEALKENIVIKKQLESYEFDFILKVKNLILKTDPDHRFLAFWDERSQSSQALFLIPAPFMTDAAGERSDAVHYRVNKHSDSEYNFTVVADANWINSPDRYFPVKIDPTIIEMEPVYSGNAYISTSILPGDEVDDSGRVGYDKCGNEYHSVISYALPDIGSATAIVGGSMTFYIGPGEGPVPQICINVPGAQELYASNVGNVYVTLNSSAISAWYNGVEDGAYASVFPIARGECEEDKDHDKKHDKYKKPDGVQPDVEDGESGMTTSTTIPNDGVQPDVEDTESGAATSTTIPNDGVYPDVGYWDDENNDTTDGVANPYPGGDYEIDEPTDDLGVANPGGGGGSEIEEPTYNHGGGAGNNTGGYDSGSGEDCVCNCYNYYQSNNFSLRNINEPVTNQTILVGI